jgi:lipopolysaccharide biosynthesis protein
MSPSKDQDKRSMQSGKTSSMTDPQCSARPTPGSQVEASGPPLARPEAVTATPVIPETVTRSDLADAKDEPSVKLIAFYLPQFHPIPENDQWWGKGFTEWTNVTKATPFFKDHYQPRLPADLGFYDLRLREARHAQIALAKSAGVHGFCYYYYWFSGHRLLERPLDEMLSDKESDMPFCLCWANENWTRRWDGAENEVLIAQRYRPEDDLAFIRSLEPFLRDPRYIRVDGAPLLIVYKPQDLPDAAQSLRVWREYCESAGIGKLHLACALTSGNWDHLQYGFDSGVEFPPHNIKARNLAPEIDFFDRFEGYCPDYKSIAEQYLANRYGPDRSVFRGVIPSWDNTARRGSAGTVVLNGTPENYEYWLSQAVRQTRTEFPAQDRFVFVNAWNEWAEGCHLEPCRRNGHRFLEATTCALSGSALLGWTQTGVPDVARLPYGARNKHKSWKSRTFRMVRDVLNGRAFR